MKVLFANDFFHPQLVGGVERHVLAVTQDLVKRGWEVHVLTTGSKRLSSRSHHGVQVWRINPSIPALLIKFQAVDPRIRGVAHHLLSEHNFDLIVAHSIQRLSPAIVEVANEFNVPMVITSHNYGLVCLRETIVRSNGQRCPGPWPNGCAECALWKVLGPGAQLLAPLFSGMSAQLLRSRRKCFERVNVHITPSSSIARILHGFGLSPIIHILNGIDLHSFDPDISTTELSNTFNLDEPVIVFVGRLVAEKGISWLLQALATVPGQFKVLIVGDGHPGYVAQLVELVHQLGLAGRVIFAGRLPHSLLLQAYKMAVATIVPSLWDDPLPTVALESLAMATPVIGSRVGGIPDIVSPGTGWLVPPGDVRRLAAAIEVAITDESRNIEMGQRARHIAETKFSFERMMSHLTKLYKAVSRGTPPCV